MGVRFPISLGHRLVSGDEVVAKFGAVAHRRCRLLCCGCGHAAGFVSDASVMKWTSHVKAVITLEPHLSNH